MSGAVAAAPFTVIRPWRTSWRISFREAAPASERNLSSLCILPSRIFFASFS